MRCSGVVSISCFPGVVVLSSSRLIRDGSLSVSMGVLGMFLCGGAARSSVGGGGLLVEEGRFSKGRWDSEPMVDVSIESSVLFDLCLEDRERVDVECEEVVCLFLFFLLCGCFLCLPRLIFFFPILVGLVALVLR